MKIGRKDMDIIANAFTPLDEFPMMMKNLADNLTLINISNDASELSNIMKDKNKTAIIIGGGPGIYENHHLALLEEHNISKSKYFIITTDKMLVPCLGRDIIPDYVITSDIQQIISKFYKPEIIQTKGKDIGYILPTIVSPEIPLLCPGNKYFYNIAIDSPEVICKYCKRTKELKVTVTEAINYLTQQKAMMTQIGDCGSMAWRFAAGMGAKQIVMIGMDYGFAQKPEEVETIPTYKTFLGLCKGDKEEVKKYFKIHINDYFNTQRMVDGIYESRAMVFLNLAKSIYENIGIKTINCTGAGPLYGPGIDQMSFEVCLSGL